MVDAGQLPLKFKPGNLSSGTTEGSGAFLSGSPEEE